MSDPVFPNIKLLWPNKKIQSNKRNLTTCNPSVITIYNIICQECHHHFHLDPEPSLELFSFLFGTWLSLNTTWLSPFSSIVHNEQTSFPTSYIHSSCFHTPSLLHRPHVPYRNDQDFIRIKKIPRLWSYALVIQTPQMDAGVEKQTKTKCLTTTAVACLVPNNQSKQGGMSKVRKESKNNRYT